MKVSKEDIVYVMSYISALELFGESSATKKERKRLKKIYKKWQKKLDEVK